MMSFCKKSGVHSVLGLQPNSAIDFLSPFDLDLDLDQPPPKYRIGLITPAAVCSGKDQIHDDRPFSKKVINDEKSSLLKLLPPPPLVPPPLACLPSALSKKDPGGIGFIDEMGGGVDGLMSCTESLGFESSDERTVDDNIELDMRMEDTAKSAETWRKVEEKRESIQQKKKKNFPPPISSLNHDGKPNFFLRPMRKDGRLELTEVRIERPRVLHASRQDGRLRLHLIKNDYDDDDDQDHENEEHVEEEEEVEEIIGEENQEKIEDWKLEEFNRNYTDHHHHHDYLHHHDDHHHHHHHHHHHNLHVWRQPCVTTR